MHTNDKRIYLIEHTKRPKTSLNNSKISVVTYYRSQAGLGGNHYLIMQVDY